MLRLLLGVFWWTLRVQFLAFKKKYGARKYPKKLSKHIIVFLEMFLELKVTAWKCLQISG